MNPYAPPTSDGSRQPRRPRRERGGCLTAWLVVAMIGYSLGGAAYFFASATLAQQTTYSRQQLVFLGVQSVAHLAFTVAIWNWKKWGLYGSLAVAAVGIGIALQSGTRPEYLVLALTSNALLVTLVMLRWSHFE